jgi:AcrR family transcriptional regulator
VVKSSYKSAADAHAAADAAPPSRSKRGPNAVRRLATRQRLLEAAVACLHEHGYHRTTTQLVLERAGVSRGSLLHQFPSKADLMVAVAEHIAAQRAEANESGLRGVPPAERMGALVDILWGQVASPSGVARLEIMLGARSDADLAAKLAALNARLDQRHRDAVWKLARSLGAADRGRIDATVQLYAAALRGLSVDALFPHSREHVDAAVELLKQLMNQSVQAEAARERTAHPPNQA